MGEKSVGFWQGEVLQVMIMHTFQMEVLPRDFHSNLSTVVWSTYKIRTLNYLFTVNAWRDTSMQCIGQKFDQSMDRWVDEIID